jgi:hypothetical protein
MSVPRWRTKRDESDLVAQNPNLTTKLANRVNQALGACFSPYKDLLSKHTASGRSASTNPDGCWQRTCSCR